MLTEIQKHDDLLKGHFNGVVPFNWPDFNAYMLSHQFKRIGAGSNGSVYEHPNYPWVIKVFRSYDKPYIYWLDWCMKHQYNPWVPKVRGKLVKFNDKIYGVRLENLDPLDSNKLSMMYAISALCTRMIHAQDPWTLPVDDKRLQNISNSFPEWRKDKYLHEAITAICGYGGGSDCLDINADNILHRSDGHLVIIDPLAN